MQAVRVDVAVCNVVIVIVICIRGLSRDVEVVGKEPLGFPPVQEGAQGVYLGLYCDSGVVVEPASLEPQDVRARVSSSTKV